MAVPAALVKARKRAACHRPSPCPCDGDGKSVLLRLGCGRFTFTHMGHRLLTRYLTSYATPFITGLFLVSLISGIALFLHVGPGGLHGMHEWLSVLLILPFVLHVWRNWRPMTNYFRHIPMAIALAVSGLAAVPFLVPAGESATAGGPPQFQLAHLVLTRTASDVAPAVGMSTDALMSRLSAAGFTVTDAGQPLTRIAAESGKSEVELAVALTKGGE